MYRLRSAMLGLLLLSAFAAPRAEGGLNATCCGDCNGDGSVAINELITLVNIALGSQPDDGCAGSCDSLIDITDLIRAVNNALTGCPNTPVPTATATALPTGTAAATVTPTMTAIPTGTASATATPTVGSDAPLGVRRFSLDPATSQFVAHLPTFSFPTSGLTGFLELSAGVPDANGFAFVAVTDASEYLAIGLPTAGTAVCVRILRDQLPVANAGFVACRGGAPFGLELVQDRYIGFVGACAGGPSEGAACTTAADCPDSSCFSAADCTATGGRVEAEVDAYPGVCQGPLAGAPAGGDAGPGAVLISPDPMSGLIAGLPAEIVSEAALPCGDEPVAPGFSGALALTTATALARIVDPDLNFGAVLEASATGTNFSCTEWTRENGPGTLVLSAPALNTLVSGAPTDIITSFILRD